MPVANRIRIAPGPSATRTRQGAGSGGRHHDHDVTPPTHGGGRRPVAGAPLPRAGNGGRCGQVRQQGRHEDPRPLSRQRALRGPAGECPQGRRPHAPELCRRRHWRVAPRDGGHRGRGAGAVFRPAAGQPVRPSRAARHHERGLHQWRLQPHLRLRRHPPEDDHSSRRAGDLGHPGSCRDEAGQWPRPAQCARARGRDRMPDRQRGVSQSLRCRLAHHRDRRRVRRGRRRGPADGPERTADGVGARARRSRWACANPSAR